MILLLAVACATRIQGQLNDVHGAPLAGVHIDIAKQGVKTAPDGSFRLIVESKTNDLSEQSLKPKAKSDQSSIVCLEPIRRRGNVLMLGECRVIPINGSIPYLEQTQAPQIGD